MQNKLSQNFLIGISFLIALVLLYFGVNFLKGVNVLKKKNTYSVVFLTAHGFLRFPLSLKTEPVEFGNLI